MPHITLGSDQPGIRGLFWFRPETAGPLCELVEVLLRGDHTLSRGERELIAAYVSGLNDCTYCTRTHAAYAAAQLPEGMTLVDQVHADPDAAPVSDKMKALLGVAAAVQRGGQHVRPEDVAAARQAGATDLEIHDTVLIAAAFCMYNRYVDGLAATTPDDGYALRAERLVTHGYMPVAAEARRHHSDTAV